jgi:copper chaperone CopZ
MTTDRLHIEGMHCGHCTALVKNSLSLVKGVVSSEVDVGGATVVYDENETTRREIEKAVTRFGYRITD